jgi:hypothetical protein
MFGGEDLDKVGMLTELVSQGFEFLFLIEEKIQPDLLKGGELDKILSLSREIPKIFGLVKTWVRTLRGQLVSKDMLIDQWRGYFMDLEERVVRRRRDLESKVIVHQPEKNVSGYYKALYLQLSAYITDEEDTRVLLELYDYQEVNDCPLTIVSADRRDIIGHKDKIIGLLGFVDVLDLSRWDLPA